MREKKRKYENRSTVDFLLLREKLGLKRYKKQSKRNEEKRKILLELALKKIREKEERDFILIANKRRKIR